MKEKNLEMERLVFFSDAVVAIAITLLALDLRIDKTAVAGLLSFDDLSALWKKLVPFFLSFLLIAVFWKIHYKFFSHIRRIDNRIFQYNLLWLLCIIMLPFSTTLVSEYFGQKASVLVYAINTLLITIFQNSIWDYASVRPDYLKEAVPKNLINGYRFDCNVAMINAIIAIILSFIWPVVALITLFIRPLMIALLRRVFRKKGETSI